MSVWREFLARALIASFGIPLIVLCGWWGDWPWLLLVAGLTVVALGELYSGFYAIGARPHALLGYVWAFAILWAAQFHSWHYAWLLIGQIMFLASITVALRLLMGDRRAFVSSLATTVLGLAYVAIGMSFLCFLRQVDIPSYTHVRTWSLFNEMGAVLIVILPVWASDTGAFLVGRLWGRHRLCPNLSPGKTVEGSIGGFVSTVLATLLLGWPMGLTGWVAVGLGAATGACGQIGDLIASAIKRDLGLKDFGNLLGAHGGVLDRFDGLILAMPVAYVYLALTFGHGLGAGL